MTFTLDHGAGSGKFAVDPDTGRISVAGNLDREEQEVYEFRVTVTDSIHVSEMERKD